jgi:hypothetical protein
MAHDGAKKFFVLRQRKASQARSKSTENASGPGASGNPAEAALIARIVPLLVRRGWYALERQPDKV